MKSAGTEVERTIYGRSEKLQSNVLQVLEEVIASAQVDSPFPFCGGAVGYIGYDVIRQYENIGADLYDPLNIPEVHLLLYREFIVYDHLRQKLSFVYVCREDDSADYEEVYERLQIYKEEVLQGEEAEVTEIRSTLSFASSITEKILRDGRNGERTYWGRGYISSCIISAFAKRMYWRSIRVISKTSNCQSITIYVLYRFSRLCCTRFFARKFVIGKGG